MRKVSNYHNNNWEAVCNKIVADHRIIKVDNLVISGSDYKHKVAINATIESRAPNGIPFTVSAEKEIILAEIDKAITKIQSTVGFFHSKSSDKEKVLIDLYQKIYSANDGDIKQVIDKWKTAGNNVATIKEPRQNFPLWDKNAPTRSQDMLASITAKATRMVVEEAVDATPTTPIVSNPYNMTSTN